MARIRFGQTRFLCADTAFLLRCSRRNDNDECDQFFLARISQTAFRVGIDRRAIVITI
jgi:hypothetical protein